jgi:dynein heavy chain
MTNRVLSYLKLIETLFLHLIDIYNGADNLLRINPMEREIIYMMILIFCHIWTIGQNYKDVNGKAHQSNISQLIKTKIVKIFISFPIEGDIFDYYIDFKLKRFKNWKDLLQPYEYDPTVNPQELFVPTSDTIKYIYIIEKLTHKNNNTILIGDSGVGKTNIINSFMGGLNSEKFIRINMCFSQQTVSQVILDSITDKGRVIKKKKNLLGYLILH